MRVLLGSLGFAVGLVFICWQTVVAAPTNITTTREVATPISTIITMREVLGGAYQISTLFVRASSPDLPKGLGITPTWGEITGYEEELAERAFRAIDSAAQRSRADTSPTWA
jgi:hypothetical protein